VIDPGMAFGTGDHPTTRGVVRLMQGAVRPGDLVADLGAGSAVLSIAAIKLGAARAAAIEFDPDAIGNAEENVARNGAPGASPSSRATRTCCCRSWRRCGWCWRTSSRACSRASCRRSTARSPPTARRS
jgi:ribosomal protein L11 methylase PrmA